MKPHAVMIQVDAIINTGIGLAIPTRFVEPVLSRLAVEAGARP